jgi:hypothetical protein
MKKEKKKQNKINLNEIIILIRCQEKMKKNFKLKIL